MSKDPDPAFDRQWLSRNQQKNNKSFLFITVHFELKLQTEVFKKSEVIYFFAEGRIRICTNSDGSGSTLDYVQVTDLANYCERNLTYSSPGSGNL